MLYLCQFTWYPGTTRQQVAQRVVAQHDAGANHPERITGWYNLVGGGAGFLLVDYDARIAELRQVASEQVDFPL